MGKHLRVSELPIPDKIKVLTERRGGAHVVGAARRGRVASPPRPAAAEAAPSPRSSRRARPRARPRPKAEKGDKPAKREEGEEVAAPLVVGLGNPGERYRRTRHNVGFMVVDALAAARPARARPRSTTPGWRRPRWAASPCSWSKPLTFMNRSGVAVERLLARPEALARRTWS